MKSETKSPRITHLSWGRLEVEGYPTFKDAKLFPGGARAWDWAETGTHHKPGIQMADVEELLQHGAKVVILSKGTHQDLQIPAATILALEKLGVTVHVLQTEQAVGLYNQLCGQVFVAGLFHTTC
ncbi:MAG: Mth938-like domain-containing protein [Chloroflexi bacterium]|nr:Mth938-like domain-containing protein [Chloroflexota bacterium]